MRRLAQACLEQVVFFRVRRGGYQGNVNSRYLVKPLHMYIYNVYH